VTPILDLTSDNFLLDSESRMKRVAGGIQGKPASKDPVCGMDLDPGTARHMEEHGGKRFYFCSQRCQDDFDKDPERYLKNTPGGNQRPAARAQS
jgi:YHS domain-containing protein